MSLLLSHFDARPSGVRELAVLLLSLSRSSRCVCATPMAHYVLLVDPDLSLVAPLADALRSVGCHVTTADGFERALPLLAVPHLDVVVSAVRLGAYNGLHLVVRAAALHPNLHAIVTTPVADPVLEGEARNLGALCLVAPWQDPAALIALVARICGGEAV